jgi:transcriptional regulator with XRE-family HTH domain
MADQLTLRELRFNAGLSPEELGIETDVSGRTIRRLEEGKMPTPRVAKKLADHFHVAASDLFPIQDDELVEVGRVRKP